MSKQSKGTCVVCGLMTYTDEHDGDPRGPLGLRASCALIAAEHKMRGADVPLCWGCGQERERYERAHKIAMTRWTSESAQVQS